MRKVWKTRFLWAVAFVGLVAGGAPVLSVILLDPLAGLPRMAVVLERDGRHFVVRGGGPGVVAETDFVPIPEEKYRRRIAWGSRHAS